VLFLSLSLEVVVVDLLNDRSRVVGVTRGWDSLDGAKVQWGAGDQELFYNDVVVGDLEAPLGHQGEGGGQLGGQRLGSEHAGSQGRKGGSSAKGDETVGKRAAMKALGRLDRPRAVGVKQNPITGVKLLLNCPVYHVRTALFASRCVDAVLLLHSALSHFLTHTSTHTHTLTLAISFSLRSIALVQQVGPADGRVALSLCLRRLGALEPGRGIHVPGAGAALGSAGGALTASSAASNASEGLSVIDTDSGEVRGGTRALVARSGLLLPGSVAASILSALCLCFAQVACSTMAVGVARSEPLSRSCFSAVPPSGVARASGGRRREQPSPVPRRCSRAVQPAADAHPAGGARGRGGPGRRCRCRCRCRCRWRWW